MLEAIVLGKRPTDGRWRALTGNFIEVALPAVFTTQRGLAEPRYPAIKGIMMAKKKPIEELDAPEPSGNLKVEKVAPPPERAAGKIVGEGPDAAAELVRLLRQEAKVI